MNIRLKYTKLGDIRYISHLDIVKLMERIFRRGKIPIAYSEGFNPHPKMSYSPALQLGVESLCEYIDIELTQEISPENIIGKLNPVTVNGIEFLEGAILPEKTGSIVAFISHSEYLADIEIRKDLIEVILPQISWINDNQEIILSKRTKKGNLQEYNLKEFIGEIQYELYEQGIKLKYSVCSGSVKSINPKVILDMILEKVNEEDYLIHLRKTDTFQLNLETGEISRPLSQGI